ncbi:glycoside hydrolase family 43 protein [Candidatus Hydrogenedentota bacterium]
MIHNSDIQIRDPFIVAVTKEEQYYMFGTTDADCWKAPGVGFDVYKGKDLENWEGPFPAFRPTAGFWGVRNFWAPEVHVYKGRYYMFASFIGDEIRRGTQILVSDGPVGPYLPHSKGAVTPVDWGCLDGTLYVDENDRPWMVFCHEWLQVEDGEMCVLPLSDDLSEAVGEATLLFRASEAPWSVSYLKERPAYVTDGPYMHRCDDGTLLMLWSSFCETGYAIGIARSTTGKIIDPWEQEQGPIYSADGGHGMVFSTFEGELLLSIHTPNDSPNERPIFISLEEKGGALSVVDER